MQKIQIQIYFYEGILTEKMVGVKALSEINGRKKTKRDKRAKKSYSSTHSPLDS